MPHAYPIHVLPAFYAKSYRYSQAETIKRTKFQSGRSRTRLTALVAPETYFLNTVMTSDQLAIFEAWLMHTVRYIEKMTIPIATSQDCGDKIVKLVANSFDKNMLSPSRWRISIVVEAERQDVMSAAELAEKLA